MLINQKIMRSIGTHDGPFHADEVTACALLILFDLADRDKIVRTRDLEKLKTCEFVCDVGGFYDPEQKLFDHHQIEYKGDLSSAGMVLKYLFDQKKITVDEYNHFNHSLIMGVDAHDNGRDPVAKGVCSFSHVIANFAPIQYNSSEEEQNHCFYEALTFVHGHLKRFLERLKYIKSCRKMVENIMKRKEICLQFQETIPWMESFFEMGGNHHPALFIIMPAGNHWKLRGIPPTIEQRMQVRLPLPIEWAGLLDDDLKKASGIPGAIFCHKGRFVSVWETKEDALKALNIVLKKEGR